MFGGIFSAIAIAAYNGVPLIDATQISYLPFYNLCQNYYYYNYQSDN